MQEKSDADAQWDDRCRMCGVCCFEKLEDERGKIVYTRIPCRYLDVVSRCCKIFENRFAINPHCVKLTPDLVPRLNWLPRDCGYLAAAIEKSPTKRPERMKRK